MHEFQISYDDKAVGPTAYDRAENGQYLLVSTIFSSIQGEGPYAGTPAVFLRLAGCNKAKRKHCNFCDSDFRFEHGVWMHISEIVPRLIEYGLIPYADGTQSLLLLVITGGEPLLQNIFPLLELLRNKHMAVNRIQIETNGDIDPKCHLTSNQYYRHLLEKKSWVISPKIAPNTQYKPIHWLERNSSRVHLKTLVSADPSSQYHQIHPDMKDCLLSRYFSPIAVYRRPLEYGEIPSFWDSEVTDIAATRANHEYAARMAMKYGARLSVQMHQLISLP